MTHFLPIQFLARVRGKVNSRISQSPEGTSPRSVRHRRMKWCLSQDPSNESDLADHFSMFRKQIFCSSKFFSGLEIIKRVFFLILRFYVRRLLQKYVSITKKLKLQCRSLYIGIIYNIYYKNANY